jgi:hypothetical protein
MRRLALLSGALGAILGMLASFNYFKIAQKRRAAHAQFEQAANSEGVKLEVDQLNAGWLAVPSGLLATEDDPIAALPNMIPLADRPQPVTATVYYEGDSGETVRTIRWEKRRGILHRDAGRTDALRHSKSRSRGLRSHARPARAGLLGSMECGPCGWLGFDWIYQ